MKKVILVASFAFACIANTAFGQDIPQNQVPSVIVNKFQNTFPKAYDVEWEMDGENYKVEFETGFGTDHELWFNKTSKLIRHKEAISKSNLPQKVLNKINTVFRDYRVEDVKKITEANKVTYKLELKTITEEWKVVFDSNGTILSKIAD
jgi:hypothetical protein